MQPNGGDGGTRQIPSGFPPKISPGKITNSAQTNEQNTLDMITQNPITGKARRRLGNIYARTLYGKNVIQTCPPPRKGKETEALRKVNNLFKAIATMSNQTSASLLNQIYYTPPTGRNRRQQFFKDLAQGEYFEDDQWKFNPYLIERIGNNPIVSTQSMQIELLSNRVEISSSELSSTEIAIQNELPLLMLICFETITCMSCLQYTQIESDTIILQNLPSRLIGNEVTIFPLWKTNIGTQANPIITWGGYRKYI
jgi:hypothetical protein